MEYLRFFLTTHSRQLRILGALSAFLYALVVVRAFDTVMVFCLGGIIPGTGYVVSPETSICISVVSILLIAFVSLWWARHHHARTFRHHMYRDLHRPHRTYVMPEPAVPDDREKALRRRLGPFVPSLMRHTKDLVRKGIYIGAQAAIRITIGCALSVIYLGHAVQALVDAVARTVTGILRAAAQSGSEAAQLLEASLWKFDGWLERQFNAGMGHVDDTLSRYESVRTLKAIGQEIPAHVPNLHPQAVAIASQRSTRRIYERARDALLHQFD